VKISIIVPTYNRSSELENLLESLQQATTQCQIIVVDDQSTDDTAEVVKQFDVDYTRSTGEGQVKAKKEGLKLAEGEIIGFLEDDMIVEDGFIHPILQAFESGEKIVQSKVVFQDYGLESIDEDPAIIVDYRWNFDHVTKWNYGSTGRYIPFGLESGRFVHRSIIDEVPIVDPHLRGPGFGESISFCFRAQEQGYRIYFEPESVILHVGSDVGGSNERFNKDLSTSNCSKFEYYRFHNNIYLHCRFAPLHVVSALIYHIFYTTLIRTWLSRDTSCLFMIITGLLSGINTEIKRRLTR